MRGYVSANPRWDLLDVLGSIAAYQDSRYSGKGPRWGKVHAWCIVRQVEIVKWYARMMQRFGRPAESATICRRTLGYHMASLERGGYIERTQRHVTWPGTAKLRLRPSVYKFTALGRLWIKRRPGYVANPVELLAVQTFAQSGFNSEFNSRTSRNRAVDKAPTASGKSKVKTAALRKAASTTTDAAQRAQRKAPAGKKRKPRA